MERLTHEARAASALNHPNIVTVHEVIRHEETSIIVMELVEGTALRATCGAPQPIERVLHVALQIAKALAAAHAHGIVHRDIKPENILVRQDGYVKVLDFGLARRIGTESLPSDAGLWGGTLRYMSPEQARGEPVSTASDIFSFGLVLYELATGEHAFPSDSPFGAVHAMLTMQALSPSSVNKLVPARLDSLILTMLAKDAAGRPSAEQVESELGEILLQCEEAKRAATSSHRDSGRRRFWLATLAASLILLGIIAWLVFGRRTSPQFAELRIQPLTSQAGWEGYPAISPDGQSIAFTWTDGLDRPKQIYIKRFAEDEPVKLTRADFAGSIGPLVWSPDGSQIAFKRANKEYGEPGAIYSIPSTGGKEKKIVDLMNANLSSTIDWSPDGTELAFSDAVPDSTLLAIYLFDLRTGERRKLTSPLAEDWGDWDPKFSPDGHTIAFKRVAGFWADDIYVMPRLGGSPRRLTMEKRGIWGHAWAADGKSLVVSCQRGGTVFGLWRFPLNSQARPERIVQGGIDAITPATDRKTGRMVWVSDLEDLNIYRVSASGTGGPEKLIASTLRDQDGTYSPDGRIAFVSDPAVERSGWQGPMVPVRYASRT